MVDSYDVPKKKRWAFFIWILFGILAISLLASALTSQDIDEVCNSDMSILFRYSGTWGCGNFSGINITPDTSIAHLGTQNGYVCYNATSTRLYVSNTTCFVN